MNNTARFFIALFIAGAMAALATPELAAKLPPGTTQILAAALAAVLHKMNDKQPGDDAPKPEAEAE